MTEKKVVKSERKKEEKIRLTGLKVHRILKRANHHIHTSNKPFNSDEQNTNIV